MDRDVASVRFIEFLIYHATRNWRKKTPEIRFEMETLAYWLRLDHLVAGRKHGELRERLIGYYELAVRLGYLERYTVDQMGVRSTRVDILYPNREAIAELTLERYS